LEDTIPTKYLPVTGSRINSKAEIPWESNIPAVPSSLVFQTTKVVQSPGILSPKRAEAAVIEIPAPSNQDRPNSGFQTTCSESTPSVFVKPGGAAVGHGDAGDIETSLEEKNPIEQIVSNPKVLGIFPGIKVGL
jgi:hypothetical protein